jgi:hypothetical protein
MGDHARPVCGVRRGMMFDENRATEILGRLAVGLSRRVPPTKKPGATAGLSYRRIKTGNRR